MVSQAADTFDIGAGEIPLKFHWKRRSSGLHLVFAIDSDTRAYYCNGLVASSPYSGDHVTASGLRIPDVKGLAPLPAALAYAEALGVIVPVRKGTKNPGSLVGDKWQDHASSDPEQIRRWWAKWPDADIALVAGASGSVVFDLDRNSADDLPPALWSALQTGQVQRTRDGGSVRGHYVFACEVDLFRNSAGGFMRYGEVRCKNGVIIVEPSSHAKAAEGGLYRWETTGVVPPIPDSLRDLITESLPGDESADPKSLAELFDFLAARTDENRTYALKGQLTSFARDVAQGASRHDTMAKVAVWALREVIAGCYAGVVAYDELRTAFETVKPESVGNGEFDRIMCWAAAQAELADPDQTLARLNRDVWPAPTTPLPVAEAVAEASDRAGAPLRRWRGDWYRWNGTAWRVVSSETLRKYLYELLADAKYLKQTKIPNSGGLTQTIAVDWEPDDRKINKVIDALTGVVLLADSFDAPSWLDGRDDAVIAFQNTLLRVADRSKIDCTPTYFNIHALPFDFDAHTQPPRRWLAFLDSVWPGDAEAVGLVQEFFGWVICGGLDNIHKMLVLIGPTRSGKGTIIEILSALLGEDNVSVGSLTELGERFGLQKHVNKSLMVFGDEHASFNGKLVVERLRKITAHERIAVQRKNRTDVEARLGRIILAANEAPTMPDNSGAIMSRLMMLETTVSWLGREDKTLLPDLKSELSSVLLWALDGYDRLAKRGYFIEPASGDELREMLSGAGAPIKEFVAEMCVTADPDGLGKNLFVETSKLYSAWESWAKSRGHLPGNAVTMAKHLRAAFGTQIRSHRPRQDGKQMRGYVGIALRKASRADRIILHQASE